MGNLISIIASLCLLSLFSIFHGMLSQCNRGKFIQDGECKLCPLGTYQDERNATICKLCPPGTYNPYQGAQGLDVCVDCPAGTFCDKPGATLKRDCKKCPSGENSPEGSPNCIYCPPGKFISGCTNSSDNYYGFAFKNVCLVCDNFGSQNFCNFQGPIDIKCVDCGVTQISSKSSSLRCEHCPVGMIAAKDASRCIPQEKNCPPGTEPSSTSSSCIKCEYFYFNDGRRERCEACPPGFIGESYRGSKKCVPCPSGTFKNALGSECSKCQKGYNTFVTGAQYCILDKTSCPPNFFRNQNGACLKCTVHERFDKKKNICFPCPRNSLSKGGKSTTCFSCPRGLVTRKDLEWCICKEGSGFVEGSNGTKCKLCPPGKSGRGTEFCLDCSSESYAPRSGMKSCSNCPHGFHQPLRGQKKCVRLPPCPNGLIMNIFEQCIEPATNCPPNHKRISQKLDYPLCEPKSCPPGTAAMVYPEDVMPIKECVPCQTSQRYEQQKCIDCKSGEFTQGGNSEICKRCPDNMRPFGITGTCICRGIHHLQNGKCVRCPKGTWGFNFIDGCIPCPAGTFSKKAIAGGCSNCIPGFFTSKPGQSECKRCQKGLVSFGIGDTGCVKPGSTVD